MRTLAFATGNASKVAEVQAQLQCSSVTVKPIDVSATEVQGAVSEVALQKASEAARSLISSGSATEFDAVITGTDSYKGFITKRKRDL